MSDDDLLRLAAEGFPPGQPQGSERFAAAQTGPERPTTVMIAVEDSEASLDAVRTAHRLFGDGARYFVINVGETEFASMRKSYVYPVMMPAAWYPPALDRVAITSDVQADVDRAERRAMDVAEAASLGQATTVGEVGDPATAIIRAAHEHGVDVVVIGSHERSWLSRIVTGSVERDLLREADFSVLVVK